jgi:hypothetical protein
MTDQRDSRTGGPTTGTRDPQSPLGTGSNAPAGGRSGTMATTPASTASGTSTPGTATSRTSTASGATTPGGTGRNAGRDTARAVQEGAQGARDTAREMGREAAGAAKEKAQETASEAKQVARRKAEELTDRGTRAASQRLGGFTRALRAAGDTLEEEGERPTGSGLHGLADQLERAQDYFDRKDFQGLVGDTEKLARRNPELFLAGAYAAGILIGRFLRSSRPEPRSGDGFAERGFDGSSGRSPGQRALPPPSAYGRTGSGGLGAGTGVTP